MQDKRYGGSERGEESTMGGVSAVCKCMVLALAVLIGAAALCNTVTNDVVIATSDAELRISDRGLGLGLEVVGGGAAEVKLETRPGWRFRDGSTSVTLNKAAGKSVKSPNAVGEGQSAEGSATIVIEDGEDDEDGDDEGSVDHVKPILSLTASAPKVVAYSVLDGGTNVSISLSATVTTKGKHRKLDAEGNVVEETEFLPKRYVWKMTGAATGEAETDSSTHTFVASLTKGKDKKLSFSVVGKICGICDGEVESDKATDSVEIDVYELSISRPDYLGLDRTDAGRQGHVVKTATLSSDPSLPSSSSVEWTECGICEFVGAKNQRSVSYQNKDSDTASESYLAERLAASVTLAGMDSSVVCSTNFTVVKVDVVLSGVGEDGDETAIPSVYYIVDEDSGSLSKAGLRHLYPVAVACVPADVPGLVGVAIDVGAELYEITESSDGVPTLAVPVQKQKAYLGCEIGQKRFGIHGHSRIGDAGDEKLMSAVHRLSNAIDHAHVKVASPPPLEVSVQLNSPAEGGGWPYDPVWDDPEWAPTVDGSLAEYCAGDTDDALVIYTLSRDAKQVIVRIYRSELGFDSKVHEDTSAPTSEQCKYVWGMKPSLDIGLYYAEVEASEKEIPNRPNCTAESECGYLMRYAYSLSDASDGMVAKPCRVTLAEYEAYNSWLGAGMSAVGLASLVVSPQVAFALSLASVGAQTALSKPSWWFPNTLIFTLDWHQTVCRWEDGRYSDPWKPYPDTWRVGYMKVLIPTGITDTDRKPIESFYSYVSAKLEDVGKEWPWTWSGKYWRGLLRPVMICKEPTPPPSEPKENN